MHLSSYVVNSVNRPCFILNVYEKLHHSVAVNTSASHLDTTPELESTYGLRDFPHFFQEITAGMMHYKKPRSILLTAPQTLHAHNCVISHSFLCRPNLRSRYSVIK